VSGWRAVLHRLAEDVEADFDRRVRRVQRAPGDADPVRAVPFRGYATGRRLVLTGRVLEAEARPESDRDRLWHDLVRLYRWLESDEVPGARLAARWLAEERSLSSDEEGYFRFEIEGGPPRGERLAWHRVEIDLLEPSAPGQRAPVRAAGEVVVPAAGAAFVVVSDLDDTVVETGATSKVRMARTVFLHNSRTRTPFPGVAAFYRALELGPSGDAPRNPVIYLSSSPWNLYPLFTAFLDHQEIPRGPILLRDFGLQPDLGIGAGHEDHKLAHLRRLLEDFADLPFVLVGDSGQRDAEIYAHVVAELGDEAARRIRAIYVRDVTPETRDAEVRELAAEARGHGVEMALVPDTATAARHAAEHGLIAASAVAEVAADRRRERTESELLDGLLG
jgi:phosphatidate phosphatase APP1